MCTTYNEVLHHLSCSDLTEKPGHGVCVSIFNSTQSSENNPEYELHGEFTLLLLFKLFLTL